MRLKGIDGFNRVAFGLLANVRVVLQHLPRDVTGDGHQRLFGDARLRKPGDAVMTQIVKAQRGQARFFPQVAPCRSPRLLTTSRFWAHPGGFTPEAIDFMTEPFADGARLRAGFATYESVFHEEARSEPPLLSKNPTPALILFGASDHVIYPDFDAMAARVFPDHAGPLRVPEAGHFLQWEAADTLNGAIRHLCRPEPPLASPTERAYVGLGSNVGPREVHLVMAVAALRASRGVRDVVVSPVYETDAVGGPPGQGPHLNAVASLETRLEPGELLERLLAIERLAGRVRGQRHGPRTLDLDLLFFGDRVQDTPSLTLPHPRLHERAFVLEPLADLAPKWVHPVRGESVEQMAGRVRDPAAVRRRDSG